jgi:hypothetical protein
VDQFPDKINCVKLHLVGYILDYGISVLTVCPLSIKFGMRVFYIKCCRARMTVVNMGWITDKHNLLQGVNEFMAV